MSALQVSPARERCINSSSHPRGDNGHKHTFRWRVALFTPHRPLCAPYAGAAERAVEQVRTGRRSTVGAKSARSGPGWEGARPGVTAERSGPSQ